MKIFVTQVFVFMLAVVAASAVHGNVAPKRVELQDLKKIFNLVKGELVASHQILKKGIEVSWERDGVSIDRYIELMVSHEPKRHLDLLRVGQEITLSLVEGEKSLAAYAEDASASEDDIVLGLQVFLFHQLNHARVLDFYAEEGGYELEDILAHTAIRPSSSEIKEKILLERMPLKDNEGRPLIFGFDVNGQTKKSPPIFTSTSQHSRSD